MTQMQTTALVKKVYVSKFNWRIEGYKEMIDQGILNAGNVLKTQEVEFVGIPFKWHLSHQLEIGNSRPIARFTFSLMKTEEQLKKYEKITCNFKIVSDDSPLMEFSKYGAIAPFVGMYKAMVLERFDWNETKTISSTSSILCQKSIGVVNLLSSVLANGALEMKCQVEIITLQTKNDPGVKTMKHSRTSVDKLAKDIGELLNDDEFPDLRIVVQGKEIKVHKLIICARSPVFRAMLSLDMKEKRESRINLTDVSYEAAKEFMKFLYSAELCTANYAKELLILAEMYQITDLKETCEHNLLAQLNKDNALDCLYTANLYNCKFELKKRSFKVIANDILGPLYKISPDLMEKPEVVEMMVQAKCNCDDVHKEVQGAK